MLLFQGLTGRVIIVDKAKEYFCMQGNLKSEEETLLISREIE